MAVLIDNRQQTHPVDLVKMEHRARAVLSALDCPEAELSIVVVDDPAMAELNHSYRNRTGPTNVLAFSMREGAFSDLHPNLLGDVVISADTCAREAQAAGLDFQDRLAQLLVHGVLHLVGFDHEGGDRQALEMEAQTNRLLALIDVEPISWPA